jgi:hypothetical protein
MKFHPIKYQQPVIGDSRCALYVLANLLNDNGILLLTNVGQMTSINEELEVLKKYNRVCHNTQICSILPYYIVPSTERISAESVKHIQPEKEGTFGIALVDCLSHDEVNAHTVGVFWFGDGQLAVLDPQKNTIETTTVPHFLEVCYVVGIRFIEDRNGEVPEFSMSDFPHIFDLSSNI